MTLYPYLFFTGNCAEAMEFYKSVFGGKLEVMPNPDGNGIMHADLTAEDISFFASDGTRTTPYDVSCISMSLNGKDADRLTECFHKLSEGGTVTSELKVETWGDTFGTVTDKFGIDWMVNISAN